MARRSAAACVIAAWAANKTRAFSRTRGISFRAGRRLSTLCASARLTACCWNRSVVNNSKRMGRSSPPGGSSLALRLRSCLLAMGRFFLSNAWTRPPAKMRAEYWAGSMSFSARYGYATPQVLVSCFWISNAPISRSTASAERRFSFRIQWLDAPINRVASVNLFRDSSWIVALHDRGELMEFFGGENEVVADS